MSVLETAARHALDALVASPTSAPLSNAFVRDAWSDLERLARRLTAARRLRVDHLDRAGAVSHVLEEVVRDVRDRGLVPDDACLVRRLRNRLVDVVRSHARWTDRVGCTADAERLDTARRVHATRSTAVRVAEREAARALLGDVAYCLREGEAELLRLRLVEGLSFVEISDLVGLPAATLRQRLHRTLARIRTQFGERPPATTRVMTTRRHEGARGPPAGRRRADGESRLGTVTGRERLPSRHASRGARFSTWRTSSESTWARPTRSARSSGTANPCSSRTRTVAC